MTGTKGLRRFWFEFDLRLDEDCPRGTRIGAGVTASDTHDAIELLRTHVFADGTLPRIRLAIKDVDPWALDPWLVLANMLPPDGRGVWFPPIELPMVRGPIQPLTAKRGPA